MIKQYRNNFLSPVVMQCVRQPSPNHYNTMRQRSAKIDTTLARLIDAGPTLVRPAVLVGCIRLSQNFCVWVRSYIPHKTILSHVKALRLKTYLFTLVFVESAS